MGLGELSWQWRKFLASVYIRCPLDRFIVVLVRNLMQVGQPPTASERDASGTVTEDTEAVKMGGELRLNIRILRDVARHESHQFNPRLKSD